MFLCIEILGESPFHKFLAQSGWSGKDYLFHYNRFTNSHLRAYRNLDDYYAERVDLHKSANIWPLIANLLPEERLEPQVFSDAGRRVVAPVVTEVKPLPAESKRGKGRADSGVEKEVSEWP